MERPETLPSTTTKTKTGYGNLYVTVGKLDGEVFEVFATIGKSGKSIAAKAEVVGRLVSLALKHGTPLKEICDQLIGISGDSPIPSGRDVILSIPDAVGKVLAKYIEVERRKDELDNPLD